MARRASHDPHDANAHETPTPANTRPPEATYAAVLDSTPHPAPSGHWSDLGDSPSGQPLPARPDNARSPRIVTDVAQTDQLAFDPADASHAKFLAALDLDAEDMPYVFGNVARVHLPAASRPIAPLVALATSLGVSTTDLSMVLDGAASLTMCTHPEMIEDLVMFTKPVTINGAFSSKGEAVGHGQLRFRATDGHEVVATVQALTVAHTSAVIWHNRMGHPGHDRGAKTVGLVDRAEGAKGLGRRFQCVACDMGKIRNMPNRNPARVVESELGATLWTDAWGPARVVARGGYRHAFGLLNDATTKIWVVGIKTRDEIPGVLMAHIRKIETQHGVKVKKVFADGAREYHTHELKHFYSNRGIVELTSLPYAHNQNRIERYWLTLLNGVRVSMYQSRLLALFWLYALLHQAYVRNHLYSKVVEGNVPEGAATAKRIDISHFKTFGCFVVVPLANERRGSKTETRGVPCRFLGYDETAKPTTGGIFYNLLTKSVFPAALDAGARWYETVFSSGEWEDDASLSDLDDFWEGFGPVEDEGGAEIVPPSVRLAPAVVKPNDDTSVAATSDVLAKSSSAPTTPTPRILVEPPPSASLLPPRVRRAPDRLGCDAPVALLLHARIDLDLEKGEDDVEALMTWSGSLDEPTFKEAMARDDKDLWMAAIATELEMLRERGMWDPKPVTVPPCHRALPIKWVLLVKRDPEGAVTKYKARAYIRGDRQREGDASNGGTFQGSMFAPTVRADTVRLVLALATQNRWDITQFDVSGAYIHSPVTKEIYVAGPPGHELAAGLGYRLRRSMYGLRQAARDWSKTLLRAVTSLVFTQVPEDHALYHRFRDGKRLIVPVHVDDGLITGNDNHAAFISDLQALGIDVKNEGRAKNFLGCQIAYDMTAGALSLSLAGYCERVLVRFGMNKSAPVSTPINPKTKLQRYTGQPIPPSEYPMQEVVGALTFMAVWARPDIAPAVSKIARHVSHVGPDDVVAAQRILRYLRGTTTLGLVFKAGGAPGVLEAHCDSSFADCLDSRRSTSGYALLVGGAPIAYFSKLQEAHALSTVDAEYIRFGLCTRAIVWARNLLASLGFLQPGPTPLHGDNRGAILLTNHQSQHSRVRHVDLYWHWIRTKVRDGTILLRWVPTRNLIADVLTKGLDGPQHWILVHRLGMADVLLKGESWTQESRGSAGGGGEKDGPV